MNAPARRVYYDPGRAAAPFRGGEARLVCVGIDGGLERSERAVRIGPNAWHALVGFGVLARLDALIVGDGSYGSKHGALLAPGALERAVAILYEADRDTYGGARDLRVARSSPADGETEVVEYRLQLDQRDYQRTLSRLVDLFREAHRHGHAIWMSS